MSAPSGWRIGTLSDVVSSLRPGVSVDGEERTPAVGEVATLKTGAVLRGRFDPTQCKVVREVDASKAKTPVRAGTIILCRKNSEEAVGGSVLVQDDYPNLYLSDLLWEIRAADDADPRWLAGQLQSPDMRTRIRLAATGTQTTMKNISQDRLLGLSIPIPPLPEQRKIAEILRTWDDAIDRLERLRDATKSRRRGIVSHLLFNGGSPHGTRWDRAADGWAVRRIGEIAHEYTARNSSLSATAVLSCTKHKGFVRSEDYFGRIVSSSDLTGYKLIRRGDFGFPSNHVEEGSIGLQDVVNLGAVSPIYTIFRFDPDIVDERFAFLVLKTESYRHMFEVSTSSSVDRRGSLRWHDFSLLPFPVPPMAEQVAIAHAARALDDELISLGDAIGACKSQKRGLMQKLLTGEIRVGGEG